MKLFYIFIVILFANEIDGKGGGGGGGGRGGGGGGRGSSGGGASSGRISSSGWKGSSGSVVSSSASRNIFGKMKAAFSTYRASKTATNVGMIRAGVGSPQRAGTVTVNHVFVDNRNYYFGRSHYYARAPETFVIRTCFYSVPKEEQLSGTEANSTIRDEQFNDINTSTQGQLNGENDLDEIVFSCDASNEDCCGLDCCDNSTVGDAVVHYTIIVVLSIISALFVACIAQLIYRYCRKKSQLAAARRRERRSQSLLPRRDDAQKNGESKCMTTDEVIL